LYHRLVKNAIAIRHYSYKSTSVRAAYFFKCVENLPGAVLPGVLFAYGAERILPHLVEFVKETPNASV